MTQTTAIQARAHRVCADMGLAKIGVKSVELLRGEGLISFTDQFMKVYEDLGFANMALSELAHKAPSCGAYNKISYIVTFLDGETYEGRIDLKHHDIGHTEIIQRSMGSFVDFHAGRYCPDHMTRESYDQFLDRFGKETQKEYADFRDRYDF